jgi:hypothetical protein
MTNAQKEAKIKEAEKLKAELEAERFAINQKKAEVLADKLNAIILDFQKENDCIVTIAYQFIDETQPSKAVLKVVVNA